ncbi:MAG: ferrochelatase [Gemmatimonadetes bacterium]|nr:ferrochelatase [Gemmatimonadota bacterium]
MTHPPTGILGLNLGGPRTLDDVRPFLTRLFADREIIRLPGGAVGQQLLAGLIVRARLKSVQRNYASIGGGSPIYRYTAAQLDGTAQRLADRLGRGFRPYIAFRYSQPTSDDALRAMAADGIHEVVVLTLYPHYSTATTGSSVRELRRALHRTGLSRRFRFRVVDRWYDHPGYLDALTHRVREALDTWPRDRRRSVVLLFSAHSLPLSFVEEGDPYPAHVAATVSAVIQRLGPDAPACRQLAYQSQTGPVRWLDPRTERVLAELGRAGARDVLLVPVSFVSDHIETLYEVDQLFADAARHAGITTFRRTRSLNDEPGFLDALADIVAGALDAPASEEVAPCASA